MAGMFQVAAAGQHQTTAGTGARHQGGGEAALRERKANTDVALSIMLIGGVDADVNRLVVVNERSNPTANSDDICPLRGNRVDATTYASDGFPLIHRQAGLPQGPGHKSSIEQIARSHPGPPGGDDL